MSKQENLKSIVARVIRDGKIVGLANHTTFIAKLEDKVHKRTLNLQKLINKSYTKI